MWRIPNEFRIPKATSTPSDYVTPIAFPMQQLLHQRASVLRFAYIACLVEAMAFGRY